MSGSETTVTGRETGRRSEYLARRLWGRFWDRFLPIIMIDPVGYGGSGPVCKLT